MKFKIGFKDPTSVIGENFNLELSLNGSGNKDDPFIVFPQKDPSVYGYWRGFFSFDFSDTESYTEVRNYALRAITLENCANFTISKSIINRVRLKNCSNIVIKKCTIEERIYLNSCQSINLIDSKIRVYDAIASENISASNCLFGRIKKKPKDSFITMKNSKISIWKSYFT